MTGNLCKLMENGLKSMCICGNQVKIDDNDWKTKKILEKSTEIIDMGLEICGPRRGWGFPRVLQPGGPGPRGRVGKGKSKYLRCLVAKLLMTRCLHAQRPGASAN